jgi:hypothetical protein
MNYESFVAYSCIAIVVIVTVSFLRWMYKYHREKKKQEEKFQRVSKEIIESIRWQRAMIERGEVVEPQYHLIKDDYDSIRMRGCGTPHPKPRKVKKPKPEWWRFLTEESIGSLLEKRKRRKEAKARANDPWSQR